jgi:hypothetical protein
MSFVRVAIKAGMCQTLARALLCAALLISLPVPHAWAQNAAGKTHRKLRLPPPPAWGDMGLWDQPQYYATIQLADIDGDGQAELLGRWAGGMLVNHFDTATESWVARRPGPPLSDRAGWDKPQYYTTIQFGDIDGDGQAELVARGPDGIQAWHYDPQADSWRALQVGGPFADFAENGKDATHWENPQHYTTIRLADVDGQPGAELIGRGVDGLHVYHYEGKTHTWSEVAGIFELSDSGGWHQPERYSTIQLADIDGQPGAEFAIRGADGLHVYRYDAKANNWSLLSTIPELNDAESWNRPERYSSIHLVDIDGYPGAELVARAADGLRVYHYEKQSGTWAPLATLALRDDDGWSRPEYGNTIQLADVDGRPGAEVIARGSEGIEVWHYNPSADHWTMRRRASIFSMSDANGWNVPQQYLTIQAANIDGGSADSLIGRSATGIETWRFRGPNAVARQATGTPDFPPYNTPPLSDYYSYLSNNTNRNYGNDIRAHYDEIDSVIAQTDIGKIDNLAPPAGVSPVDANWKNVKNQIITELTYVGTTYDWMRGGSGSRTLINETFTTAGFDVAGVAAKLTNVDRSQSVNAGLVSLLARIVGALSAVAGPVGPAVGNLLGTLFSLVQSEGAAPNLQVEVGEIQEHLVQMYTAALNANDATKTALVSNWAQLQAFAQSKVGLVPGGDDLRQMLTASQFQYVSWIWVSIAPAVWTRMTPDSTDGPPDCLRSVPFDYTGPTRDLPKGPWPGSGCGPAWIGMGCGVGWCAPPSALLTEAFGACQQGQTGCPDPFEGPFGFSSFDAFFSQNGWNLPCFGPGCEFLRSGLTTGRTQEIAEAVDALRSLAALARTSTSDQGAEENLAGPLEAAAAMLKSDPNPTRQEFAVQALQNFVLQIKTLPPWRLEPAARHHLIAAANAIRGRLTGPAPEEIVDTRHSRAQTM